MSRTCDICHKTYSCRQSLWTHKKNAHEKSNPKGSGLWVQTVNNQMKRGYGLKSKHDKGVDNDDIGRYVWRWSEKNNNKNHSPLLPRDIRAIIVGKSGAGKSVFLAYLLLEPDMLDHGLLY